ncbi:MAG: hypothetical protein JWR44_1650 [Hymenobacter sp.]|jgi:hypothetical protein|nr:hypothetical protein [Hymenobacter sp.]
MLSLPKHLYRFVALDRIGITSGVKLLRYAQHDGLSFSNCLT